MSNIRKNEINLDELLDKIKRLFNQPPQDFSDNQVVRKQGFITRQEAASFLKISFPTLNCWTKIGLLKAYKIGRKVYYKESEIIASVESCSIQKFKRNTP